MQALSAGQLARLLADWQVAASGPAYGRLATAVRVLAVDGRLPVGVRLPAERGLASQLGLSRTTVTAAYDRLREEGFAVARRGSGTWTALPDGYVPQPAGGAAPGTAAQLDLSCASPEAVPDVVSSAVEQAGARLAPQLLRHGYDVLGLGELREVIAERYRQRGLPTSAGQIVVTAGALAGIGLVARSLLGPGDRVLVDAPSYPNALEALRRCGARLASAALDEEHGWDLDLVASAYRQARPRMSYLVADFSNPTGHLLSASGRDHMVETAARVGATILVDESLVDVRLDDGEPVPPPVAALDDEDRVVTVGSLSKSHWGGLRTGWIRAPRPMIASLADSRGALDLSPPILEQLVALELLADDGALAARRAQVSQRRDVLEAALAEHCPDWSWRHPAGGLVLWVRLHAPVSTALTAAAGRLGVRLVPGGRFVADGTAERHVRIPYTLPPSQLREAVRRLAAARQELGDAPTPAVVA